MLGSLGHASLRGLGDLPVAELQSYDARLKHLWILADQLRPQGEFLAALGTLAPPCIALPYMAMREKLMTATNTLVDAIKARGSEEDWRQFEIAANSPGLISDPSAPVRGPVAEIMTLPGLAAYWTSAPPKWWGTTREPREPLGKLGNDIPIIGQTRDPLGLGLTIRSASKARYWAGRLWNSRFIRAARFGGRVLQRWAWPLLILDWGIGRIAGWFTDEEPPPSVASQVQAAIDFFNEDYFPETVQQFAAAAAASLAAGGNPAKLLQELLAIDPWSFSPAEAMGPDGDGGAWKDRIGARRAPRSPWPALGVFVGGSLAALAMGRE